MDLNFLGKKCCPKLHFLSTQFFLWFNIFLTKSFLTKSFLTQFFHPKICGPNFFWLNCFSDNIFFYKIFSTQKFRFDPKSTSTQISSGASSPSCFNLANGQVLHWQMSHWKLSPNLYYNSEVYVPNSGPVVQIFFFLGGGHKVNSES